MLCSFATDTCSDTVDVLPEMIEDLIARGYTFRTIDMYPKNKNSINASN